MGLEEAVGGHCYSKCGPLVSIGVTWNFGKNAESRAQLQACYIRMHILTTSASPLACTLKTEECCCGCPLPSSLPWGSALPWQPCRELTQGEHAAFLYLTILFVFYSCGIFPVQLNTDIEQDDTSDTLVIVYHGDQCVTVGV